MKFVTRLVSGLSVRNLRIQMHLWYLRTGRTQARGNPVRLRFGLLPLGGALVDRDQHTAGDAGVCAIHVECAVACLAGGWLCAQWTHR
jgi:hypothetical protein